MELKYPIFAIAYDGTQFQSYLYGIEIRGSQEGKGRRGRFNRTFMELKSDRLAELFLFL